MAEGRDGGKTNLDQSRPAHRGRRSVQAREDRLHSHKLAIDRRGGVITKRKGENEYELARREIGALTPAILGDLVFETYRQPRSMMEQVAWRKLLDQGLYVVRRGWPDFAVIDDQGRLSAVEVKAQGDELHGGQHALLKLLGAHGVPSYVYREGVGFVPMGEENIPWKDRHES